MWTISYRRHTAYVEKDREVYCPEGRRVTLYCGQVMTDGGVINFEGYSWEEVKDEFHWAIDDYLDG